MVCCAVATCKNHCRRAKERGISFYKFPKDSETRKRWVHACKRADKFTPSHARVCSQHFEDDDFERDLRAELLNLPPKKRLKRGVVPHLSMPGGENKNCGKSSRSLRLERRAAKKEVERLLAEAENLPVEGSVNDEQTRPQNFPGTVTDKKEVERLLPEPENPVVESSVNDKQTRPQNFPGTVTLILLLVTPVTDVQKLQSPTQDASSSALNERTAQDAQSGSRDLRVMEFAPVECKQESEDTETGSMDQQLAEFRATEKSKLKDFKKGGEQEIIPNPVQVLVQMGKDQYDTLAERIANELRQLPSEIARERTMHLISQILSDAQAGKYDQPGIGNSSMP